MRRRGTPTMRIAGLAVTLAALALVTACGGGGPQGGGDLPSFSLAWSEYPSWSAFGVAHELGLVDGREGHVGEIETKHGVDLVLREADYDSCITMYGAGQADAACLTNMDSLNPALTRRTVAILPTSTSHGADAVLVDESIRTVKDLHGKPVYGLAKTVSEYMFVRNLELLGEQEADFRFTNMDPQAAATAMQQRQDGYAAIAVWNPFVLETLNRREDAKVLFDSTSIPGEIVDMVVVAQEALDREGGDAFAMVILDTFYAINQRLADPATRDETLVALGEKFSHLDLESMKTVVEQTQFYSAPGDGAAVLAGQDFREVMGRVVSFCASHDIVDREPVVGYGSQADAPDADFRVDPTWVTRAASP